MKSLQDYPLAELKHIYRLLHAQLADNMELMDAQLMEDLQSLLQQRARAEGVDVSHHAQWAAWLGEDINLTLL